ncbi:MAG: class I SAM-dependent methyltransferase [Bdellovibrionales bacterium]|nr:class I SAM-dependent methyltransferase [Bdellovibrionales bacterium]
MIDIYDLYEEAVQDPKKEVAFLARVYKTLRKKNPVVLREDFCGTFLNSAFWVKSKPNRKAIAVDKDRRVLRIGEERNLAGLTSDEKKRLKFICSDVIRVKCGKSDITAILNFSIGYFHKRELLVKYFKHLRRSLNPGGIVCLDLLGGYEVEDDTYEKRIISLKSAGKFWYIWEQHGFDPIQRRVKFTISFKSTKGKLFKNVFTYDWRLWSIPELKDIFQEAGFKHTHVYWEGDDENGSGNGIYTRRTKVDNCEVWVAYLVAEK